MGPNSRHRNGCCLRESVKRQLLLSEHRSRVRSSRGIRTKGSKCRGRVVGSCMLQWTKFEFVSAKSPGHCKMHDPTRELFRRRPRIVPRALHGDVAGGLHRLARRCIPNTLVPPRPDFHNNSAKARDAARRAANMTLMARLMPGPRKYRASAAPTKSHATSKWGQQINGDRINGDSIYLTTRKALPNCHQTILSIFSPAYFPYLDHELRSIDAV